MLKIENNTIILDGTSTTIELPAIQADASVALWSVPTSYRENGLFVAVQLAGQPEEIPACNPADTQRLGRINYPAPAAAKLATAKLAKLQAINAACDAAVFSLTASYPAAETQSWPQQVKEADAYTLNPATPIPLLQSIADQRGLDVAELAGRVHSKGHVYAIASGLLIGKRQALEDAIDAAQAIEELAAINWDCT